MCDTPISVDTSTGMRMYLVQTGEVIPCEVYGTFQIDEGETIMVLSCLDKNIPFQLVPIEEVGVSLFYFQEDACEEASKNIADCDYLPAKAMRVIESKCFHFKKDEGATAFYAVLDNGYVYIKDYYSAGFLVKGTGEDAKRILGEKLALYRKESVPSEQKPLLQNMYRVKRGSFDFAERSYLEAQ